MAAPSTTSHQLIAALRDAHAAVKLETIDLCFLVALELRAEVDSAPSLEEEQLIDVFEQVCAVIEPGADNPRKRATHAIQRLREQHMLARLDGGRLMSAGEYTLTGLARHIVAFFAKEEALTRESLTLLTGTLISKLAEVEAIAGRAHDEADWQKGIIAPLRVTVGDLIGGIERRQRGLDAQQASVQQRIAALLGESWFDSLDQCQQLLDDTASTLSELRDVLLDDASHIQAHLHAIRDRAEEALAIEAEDAAQRVIEHVDRVVAWGTERQRAWSDYYQYVHGFLRDVVRLDPDRALSERLRTQLLDWSTRPIALRIADTPGLRLIREPEVTVERPPLVRRRTEREVEPTTIAAVDDRATLEQQVREAIEAGAHTLAEITGLVVAGLPTEQRYVTVGRVAEIVARLSRPRFVRDGWVAIDHRIVIEDWTLTLPQRGP